MLICIQISTGKILEMQSDATAGTLLANAKIAFPNIAASDLQEQTVTPAQYATMMASAPNAPPPQPVYIPTATVLGRLTLAEYTAIRQAAASQLAAGNGQLEQWLDMARTSPHGINPADPATIAAIAALGSANLLTAARAAVVFAAA